MTGLSEQLQQVAEKKERMVLARLGVRAALSAIAVDPQRLAAFAEAFYFCRVGFVRLNFILGERCSSDERLWVGLARNLWEEAGAGATPPHNTLYRRFLNFSTRTPEDKLSPPPFALAFDREWESFVRNTDVLDALVAFAVYEALDAPDYQMLYSSLAEGVPEEPLEFFKVHTDVRHVELFDDALALVDPHKVDQTVSRAMDLVLGLQEKMWSGLLNHINAPVTNSQPIFERT